MTDSGGIIPHDAEFLLYRTEDGRARVEVRFDGETAWLTQAGLAELFQTTPQNIGQHIAAICAERELEEAATCKSHLQVQREGSRLVRRHLFDLTVHPANNLLDDLIRRGILVKTSPQQRGPAVEYGPGPRFPKPPRSTRGRRVAEDPMTLWHPEDER